MKIVCPHNPEVDCRTQKCHRCGWNPEVAEERLRNIKEGGIRMSSDKKYKVPFTGYCEVWAKSEEEALDKADKDDMFFLHYDFGHPICEEDENELD